MSKAKNSNAKITVRREYRNLGIHVGQSKVAGHGVFADRHFVKDEFIEISPAILISHNPELLSYTTLANYVFEHDNGETYLGLGFTSVYNHRQCPNAAFTVLDNLIIVQARRDICEGEEIFVEYGWDTETMENAGIK